jgi:hypothetical protein
VLRVEKKPIQGQGGQDVTHLGSLKGSSLNPLPVRCVSYCA